MNDTVDRSSIPAGFFSTQKHHPLKVFPLLKFSSARLDLSCSKHPWFFSRKISGDVPKKIGTGGVRFLGWDLELISKEENFMIEIPPHFLFSRVFVRSIFADWLFGTLKMSSSGTDFWNQKPSAFSIIGQAISWPANVPGWLFVGWWCCWGFKGWGFKRHQQP